MGAIISTAGLPLNLPGATASTRYVGATVSGAPGSGTFKVGDFVIDQTGSEWVCTVAGTPGTWAEPSGGGGAPSGNAGGDLSGTYPNPGVAKLNGVAAAGYALLASAPTFTGKATAPEVSASGFGGSTGASRYVGATTLGSPATGTYQEGDFVIDRGEGCIWVCTVGGTPGTWVAQLTLTRIIDISRAPYNCTVGASDNSTALQAAHDALSTAGGGILFIPPGTWNGTILHDAKVSIMGCGAGSSILQAPSGGTGTVLQSRNWATLTGTGAVNTGSHDFFVSAITFDGNKANVASGSTGAVCQIYGYSYRLDGVDIRNGPGHGWQSEGPNNQPTIPAASTETPIHACKSHDHNGDGWRWNGPHDSVMTDTFAMRNGRTVTDAAITASAATLTSATAVFTTQDVGRYVWVPGAGSQQGSHTDGAITNATSVLTSSAGAFASTDVGKVIQINGAGVSGANLVTTISKVVSATIVVVTTAASTTVSGATYTYWNHLYAQITARTNATTVTVGTNATTTVTASASGAATTIGAAGFRFPANTGYAASFGRSVSADLSISSSSNTTTLTSAGAAAFTQADVGSVVAVTGAGAAGAVLYATISVVTNATTVTISTAASTTVSGANGSIGGQFCGRSSGTQLINCHSWGNQQSHAIVAETDTQYSGAQSIMSSNCQFEGAFIANCFFGQNLCAVVGGKVYQAGTAFDLKGIVVGVSGSTVASTVITNTYLGNHVNGAVDLTYSAGRDSIIGLVFAASGSPIIGSIPATSLVVLNVTGGASTISSQIGGVLAGTTVTQSALDNSTKFASTAYTDAAVAVEVSRAETAEALLAPKASPTFTGTVTLPSGVVLPTSTTGTEQSAGDASTKIATTSYADRAVAAVNPQPLGVYSCIPPMMTVANASAVVTTLLVPTFYPINPPSPKYTVTRLGVRTGTGAGSSTVGVAIYSIVYSGSGTFTATLVCQLNAAIASTSIGILSAASTGGAAGSGAGSVVLDFTANDYVIGCMASTTTTLALFGQASQSGMGALVLTSSARSTTTDWPSTITNSTGATAGALGSTNRILNTYLFNSDGANWL